MVLFLFLQENNAIASVDLFANEITGIHPLGAKQWKRYDLDPSPGNGESQRQSIIGQEGVPVWGMRFTPS